MIKLDCKEPERAAHLEAFQDGVQAAFKALSQGGPIPWKSARRKQVLTEEQWGKAEVQALFRNLHEANEDGALLVGDQAKMENAIDFISPKYAALSEADQASCKKVLEKVLNYEMFQRGQCWIVEDGHIDEKETEWSGRQYIRKLGVKVCPYCNAVSLPGDVTVAFDHYLPKNQYPYLRLCLYNLIPACDPCNGKRKTFPVGDFTSYAYPYRDSVHDETRFSLEPEPVGRKLEEDEVPLLLEKRNPIDSERCKRWLEEMQIPDYYSSTFGKDIRRISENSDCFRQTYLEYLAGRIGRLNMEKEFRLYFNCSMDGRKINVEPLSKLTLDLVGFYNPAIVRRNGSHET